MFGRVLIYIVAAVVSEVIFSKKEKAKTETNTLNIDEIKEDVKKDEVKIDEPEAKPAPKVKSKVNKEPDSLKDESEVENKSK